LGPVLRLIEYLTYDLDLDLTRFGIEKDAFGSAMVTNVGVFGLQCAFAPLVPVSRVPMVVLVGEAQERPGAAPGPVLVRSVMAIGASCVHGLVDGYRVGAMGQLSGASLEDPQQFVRAPAERLEIPSPTSVTPSR